MIGVVRCSLITTNNLLSEVCRVHRATTLIRVYLWDDFYRINGIDGIDEERRASEFREFKEFSEALSTFIHKAQQLIFSLNSLYSPSLLSSAALPIKLQRSYLSHPRHLNQRTISRQKCQDLAPSRNCTGRGCTQRTSPFRAMSLGAKIGAYHEK